MVASLRLSLALLALFVSGPAEALTVRVESPQGAPRMVIDGKPVRARLFFGGPGSQPLPIGPEWQELEFDFTAAGDAENGTMHFRFGQSPGDVYLDDVQVSEVGSPPAELVSSDFEGGAESFVRDWVQWPQGAANTVATVTVDPGAGQSGTVGLHVKLTAPAEGPWPDFHIYHQPNLRIVHGHRYHVSFWMRAEPARQVSVEFYRPGKPYFHLGGPPDPFAAQIRMAAVTGVNLITFPVGLPWPKPGEAADWAETDLACQAVLEANPHALLVPRIPMDPPDWWREAHPDEVMQWENGFRSHAVPASPLYREEAAARLAAFVTHLEEKFGEQVAGYHPVGQNTGEWFYEKSWERPLNGYAPADLREWRLWLQQHYRADEALRQAWHDSAAVLENAAVPAPAARHASPAGAFRDPATEQPIIDWSEFQQEAMADCVCALAHAARTASQGKKLVLFFYGYGHEFGILPNGPAVSGHYALRRVLHCPDIDVLCSPISYFDRGLGGSAPSMSAPESVALAGKMWLNEDDTHTYLATGNPPGSADHVTTLEATNAELTRNVAQEALRNFATWWMDLTATGWFRDPGMWAQMTELDALDQPLLQKPTPFRPEVAAVLDERSMWRVTPAGVAVTSQCVYQARAKLGRLGAPYGQYLLDDVAAGKVKAKLYVFLNAWSLAPGEREKLLRATRGSVRVWCYAPDFDGGDEHAPLAGFHLRSLTNTKAWAEPTEAARQVGLRQGFGIAQAVRPLFAASDAAPGEILFTYPDGSAAVAYRKGGPGEGGSLFVGAPGLTSELLRFAAREAGVPLFTDTDCNVCANGPFVSLHAAQDGPLILHTGTAWPIVDLLTGETLGSGPELSLPIHRGETRVLRIGP